MKKFWLFAKNLYIHSMKDEILSISNGLAYKLVLAIFPFIIFAMSLIGFLELDGEYFLRQIANSIPYEIYKIFHLFVDEVVAVKNPSILSSSLILTIFSASSGFNAIIRSINRAHGYTETRNYLHVRSLSVILTLIFAIAVVFSVILLIFGDTIKNLLIKSEYLSFLLPIFFGFTGYFMFILILLVLVLFINKLAICKNISLVCILPGSLATVVIWVLASEIFNIYINNYSKYSKIYGSIGSVFILMLWLNLVSLALLLGNEINALLSVVQKENCKN